MVDDENFVLDYLEDCIRSFDLKINAIHRATCVDDAYDLLSNMSISILLTDIRMPEKNGFDLLELIYSEELPTKIILLSGYSEFDFAKSAIQYGVMDYLLKPIMPDELQRVLVKTMETVTKENRKRKEFITKRINYRQSQHFLRGQFLFELFQGKSYSEKEFTKKLAELQLDIPYRSDCIVSSILMKTNSFRGDSQDTELYLKAIMNITEEILHEAIPTREQLWYCIDPYHFFHFVIPLNLTNSDDLMKQKLKRVKQTIEALLNIRIVMLQSESIQLNRDLHSTYMQIVNYTLRLTEQKDTMVHRIKNLDPSRSPNYFQHLTEAPSLIDLMEVARWNEAYQKVEAILDKMEKDAVFTQQHLMEIMYYFFSCFSYISAKNNRQHTYFPEYITFIQNPFTISTPQDIKNWIQKGMDYLSNTENENTSNKNFLIAQIHAFISKNIQQNVTLHSIAEHVYLHPVYLSRWYKKETGSSISSYIFQLRMKKAVTLLLTTNKKIADISQEVGYQKTQYFIRLFKEHFKMTPQKYRESKNSLEIHHS